MRRRDFDVRYRGQDIFAIRTKKSGATLGFEFSLFDAAIASGYTIAEFRELSGYEQAEIVAWHETKSQLEAVLSEVAYKSNL